MTAARPPLSLYVHMPWCVRKCPYCDFNSHQLPAGGLPEQAYLRALLEDIDFTARGHEEREIVSVFFGGGTPSLFSPRSVATVLARARRWFEFVADVEITLEANPGTLERGRFDVYREAGINRVSLGVQSFDDQKLRALGRIHNAAETQAAISDLRAGGIDNFNLDLMYGLPRQSPDEALRDVDLALENRPAHISHYQLTLEPGTGFAKRPPELPDDEAVCEMQLACQDRLAAAGYDQYEVSAYAGGSRRCRHNLNYWRFGDYLGVGAGAHGKLTDAANGEVVRTARSRHPAKYMTATSPEQRIAERRVITPAERVFEFFLNALRLREGIDAELFERRTGLAWRHAEPRVELARRKGFLWKHPSGRWMTSSLGRRFLNDLQMIFLPSERDESSVSGPQPGSLTN